MPRPGAIGIRSLLFGRNGDKDMARLRQLWNEGWNEALLIALRLAWDRNLSIREVGWAIDALEAFIPPTRERTATYNTIRHHVAWLRQEGATVDQACEAVGKRFYRDSRTIQDIYRKRRVIK